MSLLEFTLTLCVCFGASMAAFLLWRWDVQMVFAVCVAAIVLPTLAYRRWRERKNEKL